MLKRDFCLMHHLHKQWSLVQVLSWPLSLWLTAAEVPHLPSWASFVLDLLSPSWHITLFDFGDCLWFDSQGWEHCTVRFSPATWINFTFSRAEYLQEEAGCHPKDTSL